MSFNKPRLKSYAESLKHAPEQDKKEIVREFFLDNFENMLNDFARYPGIIKRKPLILIGSGVSAESRIRNWYDCLKYLLKRYKELYIEIPFCEVKTIIGDGVVENMSNLLRMAENNIDKRLDFGEYMKSFFEKDDYKKVLDELFLKSQDGHFYKPNEAHKLLAKTFNSVRGYVTTNYDCLFENALVDYCESSGYDFNPDEQIFMYHEIERFENFITAYPDKSFLLKLHGCIERDEPDYIVMGRYDYSRLMIKYARIFDLLSVASIDRNTNKRYVISFGTSFQDYDSLNLLSYLKGHTGFRGVKNAIISDLSYQNIIDEQSIEGESSEQINTYLFEAFSLPFPRMEFDKKDKTFYHLKTVLQTLLEYFEI